MVTAHMLINCDSGSEGFVIDELKKFDSVREVSPVYGAFDLVVKLESPSLQEIGDNIVKDIRKIKNIITTLTLMNIHE
jgi:DNA-binding Lrp family transcriptional regulator